jgi:hypothetical protein
MIRNQDLEDHAEEMLIVLSEDGAIGAYDPKYSYERAEDGWLEAVEYGDDGEFLGRFRIDITATKESN